MLINKSSTEETNAVQRIEKEINSAPVLKEIIEATPIAVNLWSENMVSIMCNKHVMDIFDIDDEEKYLKNFHKFSPEYQPNGITSQEMSQINFKKAIEKGKHVFNWMHQTINGEPVPSEITLVRLDTNTPEVFLVGFVLDLRQVFSDINSFGEKYDYYFTDSMPTNLLLSEISGLSSEWFFSVDLRTEQMRFYMQSSPVDSTSSFSMEDLVSNEIIHKDDAHKFNIIINNLKNGIFEPYDIRVLNNNGDYRYSNLIYKIIDSNEKPIFAIGKFVDVHDQKVLLERSQKDLLTGCYNKISAELLITEKLKTASACSHAIFMVDIDNFKAINDNLGHFFGDEVLKELADGLFKVFRDNDITARIGGDEFLVFLENITDKNVLVQKAEKILEIFNKTYFGAYKNYSVSGSVGIALYPENGQTYDELYKNADKALYQAKLSGKNRYVAYTDDLNTGTMRNTTKIENADRIAGSYFDYDLISAIFNVLYEHNGNEYSIKQALKFICDKYNADRSYVFETLDDGATYDNTFEYCKEGIGSEQANLQGIPSELFVDFIDKAIHGIIYSNDLRETLQLDEAFAIMDNQGILSFVHAQIKKDDMMTFFIGLDDCTKTRVWSEKEINSLQYIGKLLSIILQGSHLREKVDALGERNKNSSHILNNIDSVIYISDIEDYTLLYLNTFGLNAIGQSDASQVLGKKCYEVLQGLDAPCEFCTNAKLSESEFYEWSYYNPMLDSTFLLKDKLIPYNGRLARLEIATDISKITLLEKELQEKLADEMFLSNCVEMLHSGLEPTTSIYKLLENVSHYYKAERSYIFELSDCGNFISNTFEHCTEKTTAFKEQLQNLPVEKLGVLIDNCKTQPVFYLKSDELLPSENYIELELMKYQNISHLIISPIMSEDGALTGFVGIDNPKINSEKTHILQSVAKFIANFIDQTQLITKLNNLSYYDTLTGLKNRQSYNDAIKLLNKKHIESLGVIYIDIKGLAVINDSKGIIFGDAVLKDLSKILFEIFGDDVYRVGGDEFIVFMENSKESDFEAKVLELKDIVSAEKDYTATIGFTWNQNSNVHKDYTETHTGSEKYSRILSENLDSEIASGKYVVFLQPQMDFSTNTVTSAEALVRRVGAGRINQPPISFIPFYEKEGIISKIDIFVFETVCKAIKKWRAEGKTQIKNVAINCSRMTIAQYGIVELFSNICEKHGVLKSEIVIEITETTNAIGENVLKAIIQKFTEAGFSISLDDFGSGYSNLSSFVISDFDEVKIDMRLIDEIHKNEKSKALTEVVLVLCQKLNNLVSVAEGIEYAEQCELLKQMGCSKGQGYYIDKPMTIADFNKKYVD